LERDAAARRLSYMRADHQPGVRPHLCGLALLVACALGLTSGAFARSASVHKHVARGVAAVAVTADDHLPSWQRTDLAADAVTSTPVTALARSGGGTGNASTPVSSTTAQSPPVRGPPAEAAG
jgi:hypothetical protein